VKVFVLYSDFGEHEGCSAPEAVVLSEQEAMDWVKAEPEFRGYSEFDPKPLHCGMPSCRVCSAQFIA